MRWFAALVAFAALAGCETFVEADPSDYDATLAVDVVFEAGVPWSIVVYRTVAYGDTILPAGAVVTDARVVVSDGRTDLVLPHVGGGRYGAVPLPFVPGPVSLDGPLYEDGPAPEPDRTYTLRVSAPGYPTLTATSQAPPLPDLAIGYVDGWAPPDRPGATYGAVRLSVTVDGSADKSAGAELIFVSDVPYELAGAETGAVQARLFTTSAFVLEEATFLDEFQDGAREARYLSAFLATPSTGGQTFEVLGLRPGGRLAGVHVLAASAAYYELRRTKTRQRVARDNPFAEPIPPYSNVEGGAGVFAGRSRSRAVIERPVIP